MIRSRCLGALAMAALVAAAPALAQTSDSEPTSGNTMDSSGTFSMGPTLPVNPDAGAEPKVGISNADLNVQATAGPDVQVANDQDADGTK